ncbi:SigE family RNA polymerase sigma factor [Nocardioides sp. C4-1]|uniref:SigE family RNA polymerase sigma factor n=1 Tax=Nocardioides sp. C4-1 TaxID=3151851 RepID=UPI0032632C5C
MSEPTTGPAGAAFDDFVAARSTALWRSAFLLTGDRHKAEDLLQAALVKTWRRWDRIGHGSSRSHETAEAYVRRALATTYTDWWRRRWRGELPTGELPERAGDVDEAARAEVRHDVLTALAALPRGQRAVLVLRYFDDLTEQQTADALGVSVGTVKSQASRAMTALRSSPALTDRFGDAA